jgi:hypothetical protein
MVAERYRRNTIALLQDEDGNDVTDHQTMAGMLWREYKERMGCSDGISMKFDLRRILHKVTGLDELRKPFEEKEMDEVIKEMPIDRS